MRQMTSLLTACLALSGCVTPSDFCEIYGPAPVEFRRDTAAMILRTDRPMAERITVHNSYAEEVCK